MIKLGAALLMQVIAKIAVHAVIRAGIKAAGAPVPTIIVDGFFGAGDGIVDGAFQLYSQRRTSDERREDAEEFANLTPVEVEAAIALAVLQESPDASPEVTERALDLASAAKRNLQQRFTTPAASGRSMLKPTVRMESTADFAELFLPPVKHMLAPGDLIDDRYAIVQFIARGGMGEVYLATQKGVEREVALKTILPEIAARPDFRRLLFKEAKHTGNLKHPNIVVVYDAFEDAARNLCFIAMQYLRGDTLAAWLRDYPKGCPLVDFSKLAAAVCNAIAHAHSSGVLHLDLKPGNVMVTDDLSEIVVVDFGLAKVCVDAQGVTAMVTSIGGTRDYMAPEVRRGHKADKRSDVYSLAVILYELLTGRVPAGRFKSVRRYRPDVAQGISDSIDRALADDVADRTVSVQRLLAELMQKPSPMIRGHSLKVGAVGGMAVALVALLAWGGPSSALLAETQRAEYLTFSGRVFTDAMAGWLADPSTNLSRLEHLNLNNTKITDAGVKELARADTGIKLLTTLELGGTQVTDAGLGDLTRASTGLKHLRSLNLGGTKVTDAGIAELAHTDSGFAHLDSLSLWGTSVTDEGMRTLARSDSGLLGLKSLDVRGTRVTDVGIAAVKSRWPGIYVRP